MQQCRSNKTCKTLFTIQGEWKQRFYSMFQLHTNVQISMTDLPVHSVTSAHFSSIYVFFYLKWYFIEWKYYWLLCLVHTISTFSSWYCLWDLLMSKIACIFSSDVLLFPEKINTVQTAKRYVLIREMVP